MEGYDKFRRAMVQAASAHIVPDFEKHQRAFGVALRNRLFDLEGPKVVGRNLTLKDRFVGDTLGGFLEIAASFDTLKDISFYAGRFPFQRTRITPERYLRFHVEAWFAETYILRERLRRYLKVVERQYRRDPEYEAIRAKLRHLGELPTKAFEPLVDIRGQHVHEIRISCKEIDRLGHIELLMRSPRSRLKRFMSLYHHIEHRKVKLAWRKNLITLNRIIRIILDVFFDTLFPVVFDQKTKALKYPKRFSRRYGSRDRRLRSVPVS